MRSLDFSIIVPTRGDYAALRNLLGSLRLIPKVTKFEVIIVVNPERNIKSNQLDSFKDLSVTQITSQAGVNAARNQGLRHAKGNHILFLDDDCTATDPMLLDHHMKYLADNSWAYAVGGYYRNPYDNELHKAYNNIQNRWIRQNILAANGETTVLLGGHFSIRNQSHQQFFDDSILYGGSETEFFFRLYKKGFRFLQTDLTVDHHPLLTTSILARKALLQGKTHAYLLANDCFLPSQWRSIQNIDQNRYEVLYHTIFNKQKFRILPKQAKNLNFNLIKSFHEKICFYLENRDLF